MSIGIVASSAVSAGGAFSPADVSGLAAWYDATQITGLSDGDPGDVSNLVTFSFSYPGSQYPGSSRDPMEWGFISGAGSAPATSNLLVGYWSARDELSTAVLFGILAETATITPSGSDYRVGNTLAWPGNNTNGVEYDWTTNGYIVTADRVPPLRQNQRDDIRQGQRTSRQLTVRQVGYL